MTTTPIYAIFEVRKCSDGAPIDATCRVARQHAGWQTVVYRRRRYQLFGGVHGPQFIDLSNPVRTRAGAK